MSIFASEMINDNHDNDNHDNIHILTHKKKRKYLVVTNKICTFAV